ncbi:hypothetical protein M8J76_016203 [Diaphorina citri]|nr:hypothetical protein M8J76_016203 [Diaphorina citri]
MGYTYPSPASHMQYSIKYEILIVCYASTDIQGWDPFDNIVLYHIKNAHSDIGTSCYLTDFNITCLFLNDKENRFFTGASNGSIKIRHIRTGKVLEEISIKPKDNMLAARGLAPVRLMDEYNNQLVVAGCYNHIIQYDMKFKRRKDWDETVSPVYLGAVYAPQLLVTLHENGDLIFWKMAYQEKWSHFNVLDPQRRHLKDILKTKEKTSTKVSKKGAPEKSKKESANSKGDTPKGEEQNNILNLKAVIFLKKGRHVFFNEKVGNVILVESKSVYIQCWNMYGILDKFAVTRDVLRLGHVTSAIVDAEEKFLFVGSFRGFVRVFFIENYHNPGHKSSMSMVKLRYIFPFLWKSLHQTVGQRKGGTLLDGSEGVLLVNMYRAHIDEITDMTYINTKQLLFTAGLDHTIRIWHLSGAFISALGVSCDFYYIPRTDPPENYIPPPPYKVPRFINSFTRGLGLGTRKVLLREWTETFDLSNVTLPEEKDETIPCLYPSSCSSIAPGPTFIKRLEDICKRMRRVKHIAKDGDVADVSALETLLKKLATVEENVASAYV